MNTEECSGNDAICEKFITFVYAEIVWDYFIQQAFSRNIAKSAIRSIQRRGFVWMTSREVVKGLVQVDDHFHMGNLLHPI